MLGCAIAGMSASATAGSNKVRGDEGFEPDQLGGQELHRTKRPLPETAGSPTKRSGHGDGLVDIGTLRALMAEQSARLLESQQRHLHQMLEKRDVEFQERFGAVDARMDRQDGQIVRRMVEDIAKGGSSRSDGGSTKMSMGGLDRHRHTLVWGGWPRESRRQLVLQDLAQLIDRLHVRDFLDAPPWTSGPRRSVALANFAQRPGETAHDTRQRMHKVVMAFAGGNTNVGDRRIWCSFSRSPKERRRAGQASLVKKVVKEISEAHLDRLDVEYTSGTVWLEESRVASAVHPYGGGPGS